MEPAGTKIEKLSLPVLVSALYGIFEKCYIDSRNTIKARRWDQVEWRQIWITET